jgi:predicted dehydrogenase
MHIIRKGQIEGIDKGGRDAIIAATPDDLHYAITIAALDKGLHVL